ncbi:MAG TPA: Qat anti-phage system QueC-like protein QatC [Xanthobacteraceae bacterium]|nr:Qat anti-phage system QueC-like protein QatC [Xanthobacteraceae bacterium]
MKIVCALRDHRFLPRTDTLNVVLYDQRPSGKFGSAGAAIRQRVRRRKLQPVPRAWDFLSIALSVVTADLAGHRAKSPDGWTREFELQIAVGDQKFWHAHAKELQELLGFLTTDRWRIKFIGGGFQPAPPKDVILPKEDSVVLISGGLDSFIGAIDLAAAGHKPFAVSQSVRGDNDKQDEFVSLIGEGLSHLRLNHNVVVPHAEAMPSQRARSIAFLAYGVLVATSLARYKAGEEVSLYICENGFISINPPLTGMRLGSLSTRTCHPVFLALLQRLLAAAGLRVRLVNPYQFKTKGEMLRDCADQALALSHAHRTTSCGRYKRYAYTHCGRCLPCLIRRASFAKWGNADKTVYKFKSLSKNDKEHARYDDVRAASMAIATAKDAGLDAWLGATLSPPIIDQKDKLRSVAGRALDELAEFLKIQRVK